MQHEAQGIYNSVPRSGEEEDAFGLRGKKRSHSALLTKAPCTQWDLLAEHLCMYLIHDPEGNAAAGVINDPIIRIVQSSFRGFPPLKTSTQGIAYSEVIYDFSVSGKVISEFQSFLDQMLTIFTCWVSP
ncbi:hypothetical protein ILYODFUR_027302 [Ilyodon furcidens]|uniref:Uncharacterized protein n=1 Tax=Ilyodon furcidens TaxID=33524 RepID=A0ABV0TN93_9TELE